MKTADLKNQMTIKDASKALNKSVQRIHAMIHEGKLKGTKFAPGLWLIEKSSIKEFIEADRNNNKRR